MPHSLLPGVPARTQRIVLDTDLPPARKMTTRGPKKSYEEREQERQQRLADAAAKVEASAQRRAVEREQRLADAAAKEEASAQRRDAERQQRLFDADARTQASARQRQLQREQQATLTRQREQQYQQRVADAADAATVSAARHQAERQQRLADEAARKTQRELERQQREFDALTPAQQRAEGAVQTTRMPMIEAPTFTQPDIQRQYELERFAQMKQARQDFQDRQAATEAALRRQYPGVTFR